jgi:hypothetical protein
MTGASAHPPASDGTPAKTTGPLRHFIGTALSTPSAHLGTAIGTKPSPAAQQHVATMNVPRPRSTVPHHYRHARRPTSRASRSPHEHDRRREPAGEAGTPRLRQLLGSAERTRKPNFRIKRPLHACRAGSLAIGLYQFIRYSAVSNAGSCRIVMPRCMACEQPPSNHGFGWHHCRRPSKSVGHVLHSLNDPRRWHGRYNNRPAAATGLRAQRLSLLIRIARMWHSFYSSGRAREACHRWSCM